MKKVILTAPYTFEYAEAPIPEINDDQVLLKVRQIGICASDMQMYHGLHKFMTYPVVVGHEAAATIEKVGANVKDYKVGDSVTLQGSGRQGLRASVLAYVIPLILMTIALFIGVRQGGGGIGALAALLVLVLYYGVLFLLRDRIEKKFEFKLEVSG